MAERKKFLILVLLGKTGAGKSASGNTILGRQAFESNESFTSVTQYVVVQSGTVCGQLVTVYDTPGLFNTTVSEEEIQQMHANVLQKCKSGPCVFLLVIKVGRFTEKERKTVEKIEKLLGEKHLKKSWILFTGRDKLEKGNMTIEKFISETEPLKELVQKYDQRYHVFNNKKTGYTPQVQELLTKIYRQSTYPDTIADRRPLEGPSSRIIRPRWTKAKVKEHGYTLVKEEENEILVKDEAGDQFVIKKLSINQDESELLPHLNHPHIVQHKELIKDYDWPYLVLEHCEGGDLAQKIKNKKKEYFKFSENEILDLIVKICMALKYLHDQQILHKNLRPKSIFFTTFGTIRLGEFGVVHERSTEGRTAQNEPSSYVAPEILNDKPYEEKTEIWSLGCVIYELCMLKCAFPAILTIDNVKKILTSSYKALPKTFSEDLRQLVADTLQTDPAKRPSVSEILTRPFIIKYLHEKNMQTIKTLYRTLEELRALADDLERVHFNTTVGSLTGGVIGLAGGIASVVGLILAPFTLGASLVVTGVGIGTAVAGGVTAGASNITNMVNHKTSRQKIKMLIKEFQEKITCTVCCIKNIQISVETLERQFSTSDQKRSSINVQPGANAGARLVRGLGGIPELLRLIEVVNVGKIAAQAARAVRVAEAATGVLTALFVAVDVFFVFLDSREIHKIRQDYALRERQQKSDSTSNQSAGSTEQTSNNSDTTNLLPSNTQQAEELKSETMKFVKKIKETTEELQKILDTLQDTLQPFSELPNNDN